jgi:hypothetical protein
MKTGRVASGICVFLAMGRTASADAGLSNFGHRAGEQRAAEEKRAAAPRKRKMCLRLYRAGVNRLIPSYSTYGIRLLPGSPKAGITPISF